METGAAGNVAVDFVVGAGAVDVVDTAFVTEVATGAAQMVTELAADEDRNSNDDDRFYNSGSESGARDNDVDMETWPREGFDWMRPHHMLPHTPLRSGCR